MTWSHSEGPADASTMQLSDVNSKVAIRQKNGRPQIVKVEMVSEFTKKYLAWSVWDIVTIK